MKKILCKISAFLLVLVLASSVFVGASAEIGKLDYARITFTTANGKGTSLQKDDGYVDASVVVEDVDGSKISDSIIMKVRGNSTAFTSIAKKSYTFKFAKKKNLYNMGSGKKWALISNIFDPTLSRNYVAFSLAKELGIQYSSEFKMVEVVVDGSFRGLYMLIEPVGEGKDRVDIDVEGNDGKKDFLLELEKLREESDVTYITSGSIRFGITEPDPPNEEQVAYIQSVMDDIFATLNRGNREEIESKLDINSFAEFYLLNEYLKTVDFDFSSVFFYYKDGKLYAGPPWDYDLSQGNVNKDFSSRYASSYKTDGIFQYDKHFYKLLCKHSWFNDMVKKLYAEHYSYFANIAAENGLIKSFYKNNEAAIKRNFKEAGWKVNGYYVNVMKYPLTTFDENFDFYVNWCKERTEWLTDYYEVDTTPTTITSEPTTEPATELTEPTTQAQTAEPSEPTEVTSIPATETTQSATDTTEPVSMSSEPSQAATEASEPTTNPEASSTDSTENTTAGQTTEAPTSSEPTSAPTEPTTVTEPSEPTVTPTEMPTQPKTEPSATPTQPATVKPTEPTQKVTDPTEPSSASTVKQKNPVKVKAKAKSIKAKLLKTGKRSAKLLKISKAKGKVTVKLVKKGAGKKLFKKLTVNKKGVITLKKGRYKKGVYKLSFTISVKGSKLYRKALVKKNVKLKIV